MKRGWKLNGLTLGILFVGAAWAEGQPPVRLLSDKLFKSYKEVNTYKFQGKPFTGISYALHPNGTLMAETEFQNGRAVLQHTWTPEGLIASTLAFLEGVPSSGYEINWQGGRRVFEAAWKDGVRMAKEDIARREQEQVRAKTALLGAPGQSACVDKAADMWVTRLPFLKTKRLDHALVPLGEDRYLVIGGAGFRTMGVDPILESCEMVNVHQGKVTPRASMKEPRRGLGACRLPDGSVLAIGGVAKAQALKSVERYDPAKDQWENLPPMQDARAYFSLAVLKDGRVLIAGGATGNADIGQDGKGATIASAELYDPTLRTWTRLPMEDAHATGGGVLLPDQRFFVFGGRNRADTTGFPGHGGHLYSGRWKPHGLKSAECFDPLTKQWTPMEPMPTAHYTCQGTLLPDGRVLAVPLPWMSRERKEGDAELYDPRKNVWISLTVELANGHPWLKGPEWSEPLPIAYGCFAQIHRDATRLRMWNSIGIDRNAFAEEMFYAMAMDGTAAPVDARRVLFVGGDWSGEGVGGVWILSHGSVPLRLE